MAAENPRFTIRRILTVLVTVILLSMTAASCGGKSDGDIDAYCDLISKNLDLGIPDTNLPIEELDLLITLAPSEVRKVVTKIRNTSADIAEITDLDQLFAATFDPEALNAQNSFQAFNTQNCEISSQVVENLVMATQDTFQTELENFLSTNYPEAAWNEKAEISIIFNGIEISGLEGFLPDENKILDQTEIKTAESLCQALSLWLYAVQEQDGMILVTSGENRIIDRKSENASCQPNEIVVGD